MFPLLTQDVPHVEEKILSYLGPVDLIKSKRVSKKWNTVMQKRIDQNMFPLLNKDLPHLEEKILSYLGPIDLIRSKRVSKKWDMVIQKKLDLLKMTNNVHAIVEIAKECLQEDCKSLGWFGKMNLSLMGGIAKIISLATTGQSDWAKTEFAYDSLNEGFAFCYHLGQGCLCLIGKADGKVGSRVLSTDEGLRIELEPQ